MTKQSIAVCDGDKEYIQAFATYLMEHVPDILISSYTSEDAFVHSDQKFDVGIMSRDFLSVLEFCGKEIVKEKLYLCDENIAEEFEHLPMVYKYQSMEIVEEMIKRMMQRNPTEWWDKRDGAKTKVIGIYSPISHELSMPFGLSLCQMLRERGRVLFLDIEELSIMNTMTGRVCEKNLMDLLYLITQEKKPDAADFIHSFMGIDYISPFSNPEELNDIDEGAWNGLMQFVLSLGYDTVIILFGRTVQGFRQMVSLCEELVVLGKPGDYYGKSQSSFLEYAKKSYIDTQIDSVYLPMSATNLVDGTYAMEELIQGNLGMFVRKLIQEGRIAKEQLYGIS